MLTPSKILLIYSGGTIGMMHDAKSRQLKPFDFMQLYRYLPEIKTFNYSISTIAFEKPIDSSNMNVEVWVKLAEIIEDNYNLYDGFVILHGTDTMAYTASALSFMLENLRKPVILTGSQLPIGMIRTDGKENLITAIEISAAKKSGCPLVPEVAIYFETRLMRGNRTRKYSSEHFDAFESPNYPVLAEAGVHLNYMESAIRLPGCLNLKVYYRMNNNIAVLKLFPGINRNYVEAVIQTKNIKAIILETFGAGNAPTDKWFIKALQNAIKKNIIVFNVTQCNSGRVEQGRYETSAGLKNIGVTGGNDITIEAAVTKLMFLLGSNLTIREINVKLQESLRGEMTN